MIITATRVEVFGRPLSASTAQRRYGLAEKPGVREITVPKGQPIKKNKVIGGDRGRAGKWFRPSDFRNRHHENRSDGKEMTAPTDLESVGAY
jgi:hypothetical protein